MHLGQGAGMGRRTRALASPNWVESGDRGSTIQGSPRLPRVRGEPVLQAQWSATWAGGVEDWNPPAAAGSAGKVNEGKLMERMFTLIATRIAFLAGQPAAFGIAVLLIVLWIVTGPAFGWSDTWQLVVNTATTIVTFLMVFLIQNSQNRDAAAIQAKLDELIRAAAEARNEFVGIEHLTDSQIDQIRSDLEEEVATNAPGRRPHDTVRRLLERR